MIPPPKQTGAADVPCFLINLSAGVLLPGGIDRGDWRGQRLRSIIPKLNMDGNKAYVAIGYQCGSKADCRPPLREGKG